MGLTVDRNSLALDAAIAEARQARPHEQALLALIDVVHACLDAVQAERAIAGAEASPSAPMAGRVILN